MDSKEEVQGHCAKAGCYKLATILMDSGCAVYEFCDEHASVASIEHDYILSFSASGSPTITPLSL